MSLSRLLIFKHEWAFQYKLLLKWSNWILKKQFAIEIKTKNFDWTFSSLKKLKNNQIFDVFTMRYQSETPFTFTMGKV